MEALKIRKFWKNNSAGGPDVSSDCDDIARISYEDETEDDDSDSFFDLVIKPPGLCSTAVDGGVESPRDVFMSKSDFPNSKFKIFLLGFKKSPKTELKMKTNSLRSQLLKENSSDVVSSLKSVPKYLKLIKPFYYVKASKKAKLMKSVTLPLSSSSSSVSPPVNFSPRKLSEGSRVTSFKIVARNLGKSRSASAIVRVPQPPPPSSLRRRDDSLLEQDNGIQGAILHCKKSYEASSSSQDYSQLFRSSSDPSQNSCQEPKRYSI